MDLSIDKRMMGLQQIAVEKLQNILCRIPGKKDLIISPDLIKPLELICGATFLRSKGINKIYKFEQSQITVEPVDQHIIFFIRSDVEIFKQAMNQIQSLNSKRNSNSDVSNLKLFHIILVPNVDYKYETMLEEEGLYGLVELYKFNWDFLSLDNGLLSMEIPELFKEVFIDKDLSLLVSVAHSIRIMDMVTGKPNIVVSYGEKSEKLLQMLDHLEAKRPSQSLENRNDFSLMLIMDRSADFVSCFLTPVTYSGLLLEVYPSNAGSLVTDSENRIQKGNLKWLENSTNTVETKPDSANLRMNSFVDKTYSDNKYRHFSEVLTTLSVQAKALGVEGQCSKDMKIHEMKDYVEKKLPKVAAAKKELIKHLALSEVIVNEFGKHFEVLQQIEENMLLNQNRKQTLQLIEENFLTISPNKFLSLKLAILFNITFEMNDDELTSFFRNYFNTFGYENLSVFWKLITADLLPKSILKMVPNTSHSLSPLVNKQKQIKTKLLNNLPKFNSSFQVSAAKLKQIPTGESLKAQTDCASYVFNKNYIPTVAQLVNAFAEAQSFEEVSLKLGHLDQMKISSKLCPDSEPMSVKEMGNLVKNKRFPELMPLKPKTIFVFILGGVTFAEIAACNMVEKLTNSKIVIASNTIHSSFDMINMK